MLICRCHEPPGCSNHQCLNAEKSVARKLKQETESEPETIIVDDKWQKVDGFEDVRLLDFSAVEWAVKMS